MIEKKVPKLNPDLYLEKMDNEILLYSLSGTKAVYLNETAVLIWELCDGNRTVEEVIDLLEQAYPQQAEQIHADVITTIKTLFANRAIELMMGNDE